MKFTPEQMELIRESWRELKSIGMKEIGLLIFQRLFNDVPHIRTLFYSLDLPDEDELSLDTMRKNAVLVSHATRVATSISKFVSYLDQPEELKALVAHLGEMHAAKNVEPEYFEYLAPVLLAVFSSQLNLRSNSPILQAWVKAYGILRNGIINAM